MLPIPLVIGIGRNYAEHAKEQGLQPPEHPLVFYKSHRSLILHDEPIVIPRACQDRDQVDFEAELGVVLARDIRDASEADAIEAVLGYCCCNDISARWWQKHGSGGQFCRGKSFDTFCPIGPHLTPASEVHDPQRLGIRCVVSGEVMQDDTTASMIWSVQTLLRELSRGTTLPAGTLLLTGTPAGVGMARTPERYLRAGDRVEVTIDGLGTLANPVICEPAT